MAHSLVAAIHGSIQQTLPESGGEYAVLHTLERWGVQAPWGPCESRVNFSDAREEIMRAWAHVHLNDAHTVSTGGPPVTALLRTMWDALELYTRVHLSGVDVIAPLASLNQLTLERVLASVRTQPTSPCGHRAQRRARPMSPSLLPRSNDESRRPGKPPQGRVCVSCSRQQLRVPEAPTPHS